MTLRESISHALQGALAIVERGDALGVGIAISHQDGTTHCAWVAPEGCFAPLLGSVSILAGNVLKAAQQTSTDDPDPSD